MTVKMMVWGENLAPVVELGGEGGGGRGGGRGAEALSGVEVLRQRGAWTARFTARQKASTHSHPLLQDLHTLYTWQCSLTLSFVQNSNYFFHIFIPCSISTLHSAGYTLLRHI